MGSGATAVSAVLRIPLTLIDPGPNARGDLGDVTELAASLRAIGQQIPVVVEPAGDRWRLLDGHRRHAAAQKARLPHLDAITRPAPGDTQRLLVQLAIQAGGRRFNPVAESRACHTLMFEHNLTREQIAQRVGRSTVWVRDRIGLMHLEPEEIRAVEAGRMSVGEATLRLRNRREMREGRTPTPGRTGQPDRRVRDRQRPETRVLAAVRQAAADAIRAGVDRRLIDAAVDAGCREVARG